MRAHKPVLSPLLKSLCASLVTLLYSYDSHLAGDYCRQISIVYHYTFIVPGAVISQDVNPMALSDGTIQYQITLVNISNHEWNPYNISFSTTILIIIA